MNFHKNFLEEYYNLWDLRKKTKLNKVFVKKASFSTNKPTNSASPEPRNFYYKDNYEICSVKHFWELYEKCQALNKQEQHEQEKTILTQKKNLLDKLKKAEYDKKTRNLTLSNSFKRKFNQLVSPKSVASSFRQNNSNNKITPLISERGSIRENTEIKWFTMKEIDKHLAKVMSAGYKSVNNYNVTEQLVNSPMFKKGAKGIDNAFNYYLEKKLKKRNFSMGNLENCKASTNKIELFKPNSHEKIKKKTLTEKKLIKNEEYFKL